MSTLSLSPPDAHAHDLLRELAARRVFPLPTLETLRELILVAHYASFEQEERRPIRFSFALLSEEDLAPTSAMLYAWMPLPFREPLSVTVDEVAKIAPAFDYRCAFLAVVEREGALQLRGALQTNLDSYRMARVERLSGMSRKRDFLRITALGPGTLEFAINDLVLSTHRKGALTEQAAPALGPAGLLHRLWKSREGVLPIPADMEFGGYYGMVVLHLLHRVVAGGHGATVVILPDMHLDFVNLKYATTSSPLRDAVVRYWARWFERTQTEGAMHPAGRALTAAPVEQLSTAATVFREAAFRAFGALWSFDREETSFRDVLASVAQLSAVDGAVVLGPDLTVLGFGGMFSWESTEVVALRTDNTEGADASAYDLTRLGSRHRSAAWFCFQRPGTVAFVVSEDGPVSCFVRLLDREEVLCWRPLSLTW